MTTPSDSAPRQRLPHEVIEHMRDQASGMRDAAYMSQSRKAEAYNNTAAILEHYADALDKAIAYGLGDAAQPAAAGELPEVVAWAYQHDETGRMTVCMNDGINTPEVFALLNPGYTGIGPLYTADQLRAAVAGKDREIRVTEDHLAEAMRTIAEQDKETENLEAAVAGYRRDAEALAASWRNWNCRADMGWREAVALCADSLELHAALANLGSGDGREG